MSSYTDVQNVRKNLAYAIQALVHKYVATYGYSEITTGTIKFDLVYNILSIEVDETSESASDKHTYNTPVATL